MSKYAPKRGKKEYKQGIFKPINEKKYHGTTPIIYRSGWELHFFRWCDANENITKWGSESVVIPYLNPITGKTSRYFVDGIITIKEGNELTTYLIEIKPYKQTLPPTKHGNKKPKTIITEQRAYATNMCKWKAANEYANKKGWKFIILTEKELFSN